jgi:hypothetical protein
MKFRDSSLKRVIKNLIYRTDKDLVVIEPHLGLGDNLICLALVRELSLQNPHKRFYYACLHRCYHSLAWMFADLDNVYLFVVSSGREARQYAGFVNGNYLPIGIEGVDITRFDAYFYEQHQIDFELRWKNAQTKPGLLSNVLYEQCNPLNEPYLLVCNQESGQVQYELKIANPQNKKIIKVGPLTNNIFDWTQLVLQADEIHTIDTAFVHFVESTLYQKQFPDLYYHLARKSPTEFTRRLPWHIIYYPD